MKINTFTHQYYLIFWISLFIANASTVYAYKFRNNNHNTGQSSYDGSIAYPALGWEYKTNGSIYATPSIDNDGNIYIGSSDRSMYSLTAQGTLRFYYKTLGSILSSVAISSLTNTTFFGSGDTYVYALYTNAQTTSSSDKYQKWKYKTSAAVVASPALSPDQTIVYIPSTDNLFYALYTSNGDVVYTIQTNGPIYSSPAVSSNQNKTFDPDAHSIYFGSTDGYVYSILTTTTLLNNTNTTGNNNTNKNNTISNIGGIIVWKKSINANLATAYVGVYSSPVLSQSETTVYILAYNLISTSLGYGPYLYALNTTDGSTNWFYQVYDTTVQGISTRTFISSSPAVDSYGNIYIVTDDMTLYALTSRGSLKWTVPTTTTTFNGNYGGSLCLGKDQSMYLVTNYLYAFLNDITTATRYNFLWRTVQVNTILKNNNNIIHPSPVIGSIANSVLFGSSDGSITSVVKGESSSRDDSGPGYSIADIIFIMPLFLAGCFSLCWFIRFRILFYFRLRRMREERRLRRARGENVGDDAEFEAEFVLLTMNGGVLPGTDNNAAAGGGGRRRGSVNNYLLNNWKTCNCLPKDYENLCTICFAPLFVPEQQQGQIDTTASFCQNNNSVNNNITKTSSSTTMSLDGIESGAATTGGGRRSEIGISSESYYDLNHSQQQQQQSSPSQHSPSQRQLLPPHHRNERSNDNANNAYTLSNNNTTNTAGSSTMNALTSVTTADSDVIPSESVVLPCGHIFHRVCISSWAASHSSCPVCRFKPTANNNNQNDTAVDEEGKNNNDNTNSGTSANAAVATTVNNTNATPNNNNSNMALYTYNYRSIIPHGRF